jgi:hypothetical protein
MAAIYSQTRLMFGWYLGWVITEKAVKTDDVPARWIKLDRFLRYVKVKPRA